MKFVFFGNSLFSRLVIETLVQQQSFPVAVVTKPSSDLQLWAIQNHVKIFTPISLTDPLFIDSLKRENADIYVVAAFSKLPKDVFTIPPYGSVNIHPSLLPKYRGANPERAQILNYEQDIGVTLHCIDEKYDHGPIIAQSAVRFNHLPQPASEIGRKLACVGGELLAERLKPFIEQKLLPLEQEEEEATHCSTFFTAESREITPEMEASEQFRRFCAHEQKTILKVQTKNDVAVIVSIAQAVYKKGKFSVCSVRKPGSLKSEPYEVFLKRNGLTYSQWAKLSLYYNHPFANFRFIGNLIKRNLGKKLYRAVALTQAFFR